MSIRLIFLCVLLATIVLSVAGEYNTNQCEIIPVDEIQMNVNSLSLELIASTTNQLSILQSEIILYEGLVVEGNSLRDVTSTLLIQDLDSTTTIFQDCSVSMIGNDATIGSGGVLILNTNTYLGDASFVLNENSSILVEDSGTFEWQRGSILGDGSTTLILESGSSLIMSPSTIIDPIQRELSQVSMEVHSSWIFSSETIDIQSCEPIPPLDIDVMELSVSKSTIELFENGFLSFELETDHQHFISLQDQSTFQLQDSTFIDGEASSWEVESSSWIQGGSSISILSNFEMTKSDITLTDESIMQFSSGEVNFYNVSLELQINSSMDLYSTISEWEHLSISISGSSSISVRDEAKISIDTSSPVIFEQNSSIFVSNMTKVDLYGTISLMESSSLIVEESSSFTVNGNRICDVPLTYDCHCYCGITASFTQHCGEGVDEASCLQMCYTDGVQCSGSSCGECGGFCEPTCFPSFKTDNAHLSFAENSNSTVSSDSIFILNFGDLKIENNHSFSLLDGEFEIFDGNFTAHDDSVMDFDTGILEVVGGYITFQDFSQLHAEHASELEMLAGAIEMTDNTEVILSNSLIEIAGGDLIFSGQSSFSCEFLPYDYSDDYTVAEMFVEISSGAIFFSDNSQALFGEGSRVAVFGDLQMTHNATLLSIDSTFTISSREDCINDVYQCSCYCEFTESFELLCPPDISAEKCEVVCESTICPEGATGSCGDCFDDCFLTCPTGLISFDGRISLEGDSRSTFQKSYLNITRGTLSTLDNHIIDVIQSDISISDGSWSSKGDSQVTLENSSLQIQLGGNFLMQDNSRLSQIQSSLDVRGDIILDGSSVDVTESIVTVQEGKLSLGSNSQCQFTSSDISLVGVGSIVLSLDTFTQFSDSIVQVSNGEMRVNDNASAIITNGSQFFVSSSLNCGGTSTVEFTQSSGDIQGDIFLADDSSLNLSGSLLQVGYHSNNNGNIHIMGNGRFNVLESSSTSLTGNLDCVDSGRVVVSGFSSINIEGKGTLSLLGNSSLIISDGSTVSIVNGTVVVQENGNIEVSNNSSLITNDKLDLIGDTSILLPFGNEFIVDTEGQVSFHQRVNIRRDLSQDSDASSFGNNGVLDMMSSEGGDAEVLLENHETGLWGLSASKFNFAGAQNSGMMFFNSSKIIMTSDNTSKRRSLHMGKGSQSQGRLQLDGDFINQGIIAHDDVSGSLLEIAGKFTSSTDSTIYITIMDVQHPGNGYSFIDIQDSAALDGTIEICIPSNANLGKVKGLDIMKFSNRLGGFKEIKFNCSPQHQSSSYNEEVNFKIKGIAKNMKVMHKMIESANDCVSSEYSGTSFSVLFNGCGTGNSSSETWIFQWLSLSFCILALIIITIAIVLYDRISPLRRIFIGKEAARIERVRSARSSINIDSGGSTLPSNEMVI